MNISEMEAGREMDALVAEMMDEDVFLPVGHKEPVIAIDECRGGIRIMPNYSTDIAAAWMVVEKLEEQSVALTITSMGPKGQYFAYCTYDSKTISKVWDDTAALAICRAALMAADAE